MEICSNHEECEARRTEIKLTKGFSAKESVKGHMVSYLYNLRSLQKMDVKEFFLWYIVVKEDQVAVTD